MAMFFAILFLVLLFGGWIWFCWKNPILGLLISFFIDS